MQFARRAPNSERFVHTAACERQNHLGIKHKAVAAVLRQRLVRQVRKSTNSTTPPNPSVNRTANGLRPSSAGYLER